MPLLHHSVSAQTVPQAPQLSGSMEVRVQLPLQFSVPAGQSVVQVPRAQASPEAHSLPHSPQLAGSVKVDTQTPSQLVCPKGQAISVQVPAVHSSPAAQGMSQPPQ